MLLPMSSAHSLGGWGMRRSLVWLKVSVGTDVMPWDPMILIAFPGILRQDGFNHHVRLHGWVIIMATPYLACVFLVFLGVPYSPLGPSGKSFLGHDNSSYCGGA